MCPSKPDVDPLRVPELVEDGIEVEVDPDWRLVENAIVAKHPRDVQENVGHRASVRPEEGLRPEREAGEVPAGLAVRLGRVDEPDVVAELLETEDELQHGPRRPALVRIGGDHAGDEDSS